MDLATIVLVVLGLALFETISSIDNAIINAEVLSTMQPKAQRWFLTWGMLFAVFIVRGVLPLLIVWAATPSLGPVGALTATFSNDLAVARAIEPKHYGLSGERFFHTKGVWFFAVVSVLLSVIVWYALKKHPLMAFGAVVGSTAFFIVHGFKQNAELREKELMNSELSDTSKIFYLEVIDTTFSIDGVLGAFCLNP